MIKIIEEKRIKCFCVLAFQLKESGSNNTDLQHQLEKAKQQHQELQALQQNTNGKLREAQVPSTRITLVTILKSLKPRDAECHCIVSFKIREFLIEKNCYVVIKLSQRRTTTRISGDNRIVSSFDFWLAHSQCCSSVNCGKSNFL